MMSLRRNFLSLWRPSGIFVAFRCATLIADSPGILEVGKIRLVLAKFGRNSDDDSYDKDKCAHAVARLHEVILNDASVGAKTSGIALALSCLEHCTGSDEGVVDVVRECHDKLNCSSDPFTSIDVENAFAGVSLLECTEEGVLPLVDALRIKLVAATVPITLRALTFGYFGLQSMQSTEIQVRSLLKELNRRLREADGSMATDDYSRVFWGLQNMSLRQDEVRDLLTELVTRIKRSKEDLSRVEESAMFGLYHMNRKDTTVKSLLAELKKRHCDPDGDEMGL
jgi:hypothetical protein